MKTLKDIIFSDIKVNNNDNYLIFNEGGIGKTTQMKAAYLEIVNSHIDKIVSIFVDCKSLNFKSDYPLLSAILEKYCGNDCMESTHRERLEKLICNENPQNGSYKFIIFIDGINECESNKFKVLQDIDKLLKSPNNKIIVSSRINEDEYIFKDFKKLKVKEFTDEQIITYLDSKGINDNGISIELNRLNPSLLKILGIPMFLKLFANTYSEKHIFPDIYTTNIVRKADLLQGFLDKILNDKLEQYKTENIPEYRKRKFALNLFLPALAFEMSIKSSFAISEKDITDIIDNKFSYEYFKKLVNLNDRKLIKNIDCNDVLDICKDEFSLITLSNKSYAFSHQVWQDFFCAKFYAMCIEYDIIEVFDNSISISVRQFIGEIVKNESGECECDFEKIKDLEKAKKSPINMFLQSHNLNSSKPLSPLQTHTLIEIMKTSRNNNITADYSNLDLKNVNFYKCNLKNSNYVNTKIHSHNFIPPGQTKSVNSVAFSPDGRKIVSSSDDETIRIWDAKTGLQIGDPFIGHTGPVNSVAFSKDGTKIVSGSWDETIRIWDVKTGLQIGEPLTGHTWGVNSVAFSPDGTKIVSGSNDITLRIWDAETGLQIGKPLTGHNFWVTSVTFSPDGTKIVSGSSDKTIRIWDVKTGLPIGEPLTGHTGCVTSVTFSPDGTKIVSGSWDETIRIWDVKTGLPIGEPLKGHTDTVKSVAFSRDGSKIASGSWDETIRIWDVKTGLPIGEPLKGHTAGVNSVAFSRDGSKIVSGSNDETIRIWDAKTGLPIGEPLTGHTLGVNFVAFSKDGTKIVSGSNGETIRIWDAKTGLPIGEPLTGHTWGVNSLAFSKDGTKIVSGSNDETIRIWDVKTGLPIGEPLTGHTLGVNSLAFSKDGTKIVSGNWDGTIRILDAKTGLPIGEPLTGHIARVNSVAFSPDGTKIVSGSWDGTIRIWNLQSKMCTIIELISSYILNCDFRLSDYNGDDESEFYKIIYSNGGLVKDEFKPKPIPFEY